MILTTHALIGAAIGKNISNPWLIAIIAITFHYILDMFRHGEYVETMNNKAGFKNTWRKTSLDFGLAFFIPFLIANIQHFSTETIKSMFIGIFFSIIPDFVTLLYWKFRTPFFEKIYKFHAWCHKYPRSAKERQWTLRNSVNDIMFSVIAIIVLILF